MNIQPHAIRLLTFNILYDYGEGEPYSWQSRRENVFALLRFHAPDIFCLQEPLQNQVDDLAKQFPTYTHLTAGCGDGENAGQHMTIFFHASTFTLLEHGKFSLSETPEKLGVVGWDAKNPRLALWVKLKQNSTNEIFYVVNTHLDHKGETARQESAKLLCKELDKITNGKPCFICGDFNASNTSNAYKIMISGGFTDCAAVGDAIQYNQPYSYHKFLLNTPDANLDEHKNDLRVLKVIDHIFYKGTVQVLRHGVLADNFVGEYPSDHMPKLCDFFTYPCRHTSNILK